MWKFFYVFCILSITTCICNGIRSQNVEMKSYLVTPRNSRQLQGLLNLRDTQNEYIFEEGPMKKNKAQRVLIPHSMDDLFLASMERMNLNPNNEYYDDRLKNSIVKQQLDEEVIKPDVPERISFAAETRGYTCTNICTSKCAWPAPVGSCPSGQMCCFLPIGPFN